MNIKPAVSLMLSLMLSLSFGVSPARAVSTASIPRITSAQLAKFKAMYLPVRTMDQKTFAEIRKTIGTEDQAKIAKTNETVFLTAARLINAAKAAFAYAYTNGIHEDETVKPILTCFIATSLKYQDLLQAMYDEDIYSFDPTDEDEAETLNDLVFASTGVSFQELHCAPVETLFGLR